MNTWAGTENIAPERLDGEFQGFFKPLKCFCTSSKNAFIASDL